MTPRQRASRAKLCACGIAERLPNSTCDVHPTPTISAVWTDQRAMRYTVTTVFKGKIVNHRFALTPDGKEEAQTFMEAVIRGRGVLPR